MSLEEEKAALERIRAALRKADGLTLNEVLAAVPGLSHSTCQRLLVLLIGQRFCIRTFENRWTKKDGRPNVFYVYRVREKK